MSKLTKEYIQIVLARQDQVGMHAIGRALVHLFNRQTAAEQINEQTIEHNTVGFTGVEGEIGASMAKFYQDRGYLTPKQIAYWQRPHGKSGTTKIGKYWRQILDEAQMKQGLKNCQVGVPENTVVCNFETFKKWAKKKVEGSYAETWFNANGQFWFANEEDATLFKMSHLG